MRPTGSRLNSLSHHARFIRCLGGEAVSAVTARDCTITQGSELVPVDGLLRLRPETVLGFVTKLTLQCPLDTPGSGMNPDLQGAATQAPSQMPLATPFIWSDE